MSARPAPIEVFFSYAEADEQLVLKLEKHLSVLKREGLIATWHKGQIGVGTDRNKEIDKHLSTASIILLLLSADFMNSDYCYSIEMQQAIERHRAQKAYVIPIVLRPMDDWHNTPIGSLQALPSNGEPVTSWLDSHAAFADVAQGIRFIVQEGKLPLVVTPPPTFPPIWNIPYSRNPMFTGREEILSRIQSQLQTGQATVLSQPQAINGLGGIGKTQIAVEYAFQHYQDYQAVLWTLADTRESLVSGYVTIAALLNLPEKDEKDQTKIVQAVIRWLTTTHTKWLLIFDNADDLAQVYEFFPSRLGGHLLLTTRAQATGSQVRTLEVEIMPDSVGALFLLRRAKLMVPTGQLTDAADADVVVARGINEDLEGLPLALDQAGAYIEETGCSLSDYRRAYLQRRMDLLKKRGSFPGDYPKSVVTTWSISFEKVEQRCPAAGDLLRLCTCLAPDAIPEEIITEGSAHLGVLLQPVATDPLLLNEAISVLLAYSLIRRNAQEKVLSIHRLVQAVLRDRMDEQTQRSWMQRAIQAINEAFPEVEFEEWTRCERMLPHVLVCATWMEQESMSSQKALRLLYNAGFYLRERARYREAEPILVRVLSICEQLLGASHPNTASCLSNLAILYRRQGKYKQAETLHQRALPIYVQQLGILHPNTASCLNNLAELYRDQGKYEQAEPLLQRALSIREEQLGAEHPDTAASLNNLAALYWQQGKYKQAEPLFQRALSIRERQLGAEHPDTATSLNNLASLYGQQGKYKQAETLYRRALSIKEQQLGVEHPSTALSLHGLAVLYQQQGEYRQAEAFYQRALAIRQQRLGPIHPETQETRKAYATFLRARGRDEEADTLERQSQEEPN